MEDLLLSTKLNKKKMLLLYMLNRGIETKHPGIQVGLTAYSCTFVIEVFTEKELKASTPCWRGIPDSIHCL